MCDRTLRNFAAQAKADIAARFDVDAVRAQIKRTTSSESAAQSEEEKERDSAHDLRQWHLFKLTGFARTLTAVYAVTLLHALIKVQLSIVSRYVLTEQQKGAAAAGGGDAAAGGGTGASILAPPVQLGALLTEQVNRCYFAVSEEAQRAGLRAVEEAVMEGVTAEMGRWELSANCSVEDVQLMIINCRHRIDQAMADKARLHSHRPPDSSSSSSTASSSSASSAPSRPLEPVVPPAAAPPAPSSSSASSASPFVFFIYPSAASIETLLSSLQPQLKEASKRALSTDAASGGITAASSTALATSASRRLEEMTAETLSVLSSSAFSRVLESTLSAAFSVLSDSLVDSVRTAGSLPFASVMVKAIKLFDSLLPDAQPAGAGEGERDSSPLFAALNADAACREMCAIVYLPFVDEHGCNILTARHGVEDQQQEEQQQQQPSAVSIEELPASPRAAGPAAAAAPTISAFVQSDVNVRGEAAFERR